MGGRRSPAVFVGLMGASTLAAPEAAQALSLPDLAAVPVPQLLPAFGLGAVVGAAATGAVVGVVALVRARSGADAPTIERGVAGPARHLRSHSGAPAHARHVVAPAAAPAEAPREEAPAKRERSAAPDHAARDYADIAENYVRRSTFRARMATRAQGVAATLMSRLGESKMEGIPVIARADGSVGDVGTAWWTHAVGADTIIQDSGFATEASSDLAIPSNFSSSDLRRLEEAAQRSQSIASRVAFVDEGAYPERRTVDDLERRDDWASALRSLDEKIAASAPMQDPIGFVDSVGGDDTLDEPDNLEPQTAFIPFKVPAGHPNVVDTESYVDYLIEDEFSKSSSTVARRSSRRFLQLLDGGTQPTSRHLADTEATPSYVGKHFSMPEAAEA